MSNQMTTRRALVLSLTLALLSTACGGSGEPAQTLLAAQPSNAWATDAAEQQVRATSSATELVFHLETRHQSCRMNAPAIVRCVWARTSAVHEHFGWPHDFVTQEFAVDGAELTPTSRVVDRPAVDQGLVQEYLDGWTAWLSDWHPELAAAVTRDGLVDPTANTDALRQAYWEYMAFTGVVSLRGLPGVPGAGD